MNKVGMLKAASCVIPCFGHPSKLSPGIERLRANKICFVLFQFYYKRYGYLSGKDLRNFKGREGP